MADKDVFYALADALGYSREEADAVARGEVVSKMAPTPSDVATAGGISRRPRRRLKAVPVSKMAPRAVAGIGALGGYGTATTFSENPERFARLKRANAAMFPRLANAQARFQEGRKAARLQRKNPQKPRYEPPAPPDLMAKHDVEFAGEFSKVDTDKRQVFGWASIVKMDGKTVVDRQGDLIDEDEMEKSAYEYVIKSRKGGDQHRRTDDGQPFHASDMIESFVVTDEKKQRLGLPESMPTGWWVGFKVNDDETWRKVKNGDVTGFSLHGRGKRYPVEGVIDPVETAS